MGILNVTPDSFSGDGVADCTTQSIVERVVLMRDEGAGIIDVGGMSTRPGHQEISPEEELARLRPHLKAVVEAADGVVVSVDTYRPDVASFALSCGVSMVNSVRGVYGSDGSVDRAMLDLVNASNAQLVLMHNRGTEGARFGALGGFYDRPGIGADETDVVFDVVQAVERDLRRQISIALDHGIDADRLLVDPGLGFGITPQQSLALLQGLEQLVAIGPRVLISASRKSVVAHATGAGPTELGRRDAGTHAITAFAVAAGVSVVRVHDVAGNVSAMSMASALCGAGLSGWPSHSE